MMPKSKRLIELMMTINAKRKFSVGELAEEFGVSYRTILRDLHDLSELGVPLYSEVGVHGGYYLLKERMLPPITFSESEAAAMFFAYQSLQYYGSLPFEAESESALKKFYHYLPEDVKERIDRMKDRIVFWNPMRASSPDHIKRLLDAAIEKTKVTIVYDSSHGKTTRTVQPLGLYSFNGFWFCPAYCFDRKGYRLFRADRITAVNDTIEQSESIDCSMSIVDWLTSESNSGNQVELDITLTREGVRRCSGDLWLGNRIFQYEDGSGYIRCTIPESKLAYCGEIIWGLGTNATVKQPKELVDYIVNKAEELRSMYFVKHDL